MNAPNCPKHGRPMKDWDDCWKCTAKVGETPEGKPRYCSERIPKDGGATGSPAETAAPHQSAAIAPVPKMPEWLAGPLAPYSNNPAVELLLPSVPVNAELGYGHKVAVCVVNISPNPDDKEVFKVGARDGQDMFAYTKAGIEKMAEAAGIQVRTERVDDRRNPDYCEMRAFAAMKGSSGQLIIRTATKAFDMVAVAEEAWAARVKRNELAKAKGWSSYQPSEAALRADHDAEMRSFKKHLLARTESGAVLRAMRSLLALKSGVTAAQVAKPKVLARVEFNPDASDPTVKRFLLEHGSASTTALYGPSAVGTRHVGADVVDVTEDEPDYEDLTIAPPDEDGEDDAPIGLTPHRTPAEHLALALECIKATGMPQSDAAALMAEHGTDYRALYNAVNARAAS